MTETAGEDWFPYSNESAAKAVVKRLLYTIAEVKALHPRLPDHARRGPVYRAMKKAVERHFKYQIVLSIPQAVGTKRETTHYIMLVPDREYQGQLRVAELVIKMFDPREPDFHNHPVRVTFHVMQRMVQRLRTKDWSVLSQQIEECTAYMGKWAAEHKGQDIPPHFYVITSRGEFRVRRDNGEGELVITTFVPANEHHDKKPRGMYILND